MLNLINLLTERPAQPKNGTLVKGYAMSGSPSSNDTQHPNNKAGLIKAAEKTAIIMRKRRDSRKKEILSELKEWKSIRQVAEELGFSETNTSTLVKELLDEGMLKTEKRVQTTYYMKF